MLRIFIEICKISQVFLQIQQNSARLFCRSRKMLKNEYLDAKIGVDTAENEPRKEWWVMCRGWQMGRPHMSGAPSCLRSWLRMVERDSQEPVGSCDRATTHHSLGGSFSAVSTPILTTKYSFCRIFQNLQNVVTGFLQNCKILQNFPKILQIFAKSWKISKILQNSAKIFKNFEKFWKFSELIF